jgi:hypothetical protein
MPSPMFPMRKGSRMGAAAVILVVVFVAASFGAGTAATREPTPDPNFAIDLAPRPCAFEGRDNYEREVYRREGWSGPNYERYPGSCRRLRFSYGPILVKPGQNDVLLGPVTVEKPSRDGFITRFKPNLVRADGTVPPVEQVHLHHGTWLSAPSYGTGPFFAAGEEKTIAPFPKGYGLPINSSDQWVLLYMVHSAVTQPMETYITYDIDFVPRDDGERIGIKPAYPLWMDVRPSGYPVFNVQRSFGGADGKCTWPTERCAAFDPWGKKIVGQGKPGNGKGQDYTLPAKGKSFGVHKNFTGGTIIGIGGHLHPGGLQNEIDLIRPKGELVRVRVKSKRRRKCAKRRKSRRGKKSASKRSKCRKKKKAKRRKRARSSSATTARKKKKARSKRRRAKCKRTKRKAKRRRARKSSVTIARKKKKSKRRKRACRKPKAKYTYKRVHKVRIYTGQAKYWDRKDKSKWGGPPTSWDFSMPVIGEPYWGVRVKPGDVLRSNATYDTKIQATYENMGIVVALIAPDTASGKATGANINPFKADKDRSDGCKSGGLKARGRKLCDKGVVTHGHYRENGNASGPFGTLNAATGARTGQVLIGDFLYAPGDLSTVASTGIPKVKLGTNLRFTNLDGGTIYHSVTSCKYPCRGPTGAAFPLADGRTSAGRMLDFDSSQLGYGTPAIGPAKNTVNWRLPVSQEAGYKSGETITYFCRIHPFMRGAFKVTK